MSRIRTILALLALVLAPLVASAEEPDALYQKCVRGVVWIENPLADGKTIATGSGFLVDRNKGFIVTNYHVTAGRTAMHVYFPVRSQGKLVTDRGYYQKNRTALHGIKHYYYARVVAADPQKDLAILYVGRIPDAATVLPIASTDPDPAEPLHLIGNPAGRDLWRWCPAIKPAIADFAYNFNGQAVSFKAIHVYSGSFGGNSGGPLLNEDGEVAGVWQSGGGPGGQNGTAIHYSELNRLIASCKRYRMFSIENASSVTVKYQVRWGEGEWKEWSVEPKKSMCHWNTSSDNPRPQVRFDGSAASGFQEKSFAVECYVIHFGRGGNPAQTWAARQYRFRHDSTGQSLDLYKAN